MVKKEKTHFDQKRVADNEKQIKKQDMEKVRRLAEKMKKEMSKI